MDHILRLPPYDEGASKEAANDFIRKSMETMLERLTNVQMQVGRPFDQDEVLRIGMDVGFKSGVEFAFELAKIYTKNLASKGRL